MESSSNFGKRQVANGERERDGIEKNQYKVIKSRLKKKKQRNKQTNKETNVNQYLLIGKQRGYKEK